MLFKDFLSTVLIGICILTSRCLAITMDQTNVSIVSGPVPGFHVHRLVPIFTTMFAARMIFQPLNLSSPYSERLIWTYTPDRLNASASQSYLSPKVLDDHLRILGGTLRSPGVISTMKLPAGIPGSIQVPIPLDLVAQLCYRAYECLKSSVSASGQGSQDFLQCVTNSQLLKNPWQCVFILDSSFPTQNTSSCQISYDRQSWNSFSVKRGLQGLMEGGVDSAGHVWSGSHANESFPGSLGRQILNQPDLSCGNGACRSSVDCDKIGSWTSYGLGSTKRVLPLSWTSLAHTAFVNMNQQLETQQLFMNASIRFFDPGSFKAQDFLPKGFPPATPTDTLVGLSGFLTVFSGLIPPLDPTMPFSDSPSSATKIATGVNTLLNAAIGDVITTLKPNSDLTVKVSAICGKFFETLHDITQRIVAGESFDGPEGTFNISQTLEDGAWVDSNRTFATIDLKARLRTEILSKAVDAAWKTFPSNKMWVLFVDLGDGQGTTKCQADTTGPPDSKYCADGGVYYVYNFVEHSNKGGGVNAPWGADKLSGFGSRLSYVAEASAKSYRAMESLTGSNSSDSNGTNTAASLFNFSQLHGTNQYLHDQLRVNYTDKPLINLIQSSGRNAGTWTLPVCDASTWGRGWNWNYQDDSKIRESTSTHPPCMCGPGGMETTEWARAAGMAGFETFQDRCTRVLEDKGFQWPEGVTEVKLPANGDGKDYVVRKPKTT